MATRRRESRERDSMTSRIEFEPIGYLTSGTPVWPVRGAEDDDDDGDGGNIDPVPAGGDGDGDDEGDGGDGKGGEPFKAPTEVEWRRTQAALAKANAEAKRQRLKAKELAKPANGDDDAAKAEAAKVEAEARYKPVAVRSAAKAAFLEAGLNDASPERIKRLLRMVDLDEVDVDTDGDVTGLDEQIDSVKDDYPELFRPADQPRKRTTRLDAANRQTVGDGKPRSTGEKIAAAVLSGGK